MAAKFCCCLPLRLGVLVFTLLQFLFTGAASGLLWYALFSPRADNHWRALADSTRIGVIVAAAIYTGVSLMGLLGFLGAIFKKNALVKTYYITLWISWVFQLGSGIWVIVIFFRGRARAHDEDCTAIPESTVEKFSVCETLKSLEGAHPASVVVPIVVSLFITLYVIYVTHYYIKRIAEQKKEKTYHYGRSIPAYAPVQQKSDETYPLTQPTSYPYTDTAHSHGHTKQPSTGYKPPV